MRPETIICQICGKPAPNSRRGQHRKYHAECQLKLRAQRAKAKREDPEVRNAQRIRQRERRAEIRRDPKRREEVLRQERAARDRKRERINAYNEMQAEMVRTNAAAAEAIATLNAAALSINKKVAEFEQRLARLEAQKGVTHEPEQEVEPTHRAPIFDRLR